MHMLVIIIFFCDQQENLKVLYVNIKHLEFFYEALVLLGNALGDCGYDHKAKCSPIYSPFYYYAL